MSHLYLFSYVVDVGVYTTTRIKLRIIPRVPSNVNT